jgi:uncharacterized Zn finger protein (UPF0148 family)
MSDEFDREEERRKLEEKFGKEAADREQTERLSELLLKGATMTDIHCPECGDPIFRHEGRQFCPSCQREVASGDGQQATAGQAAAQDPTSPEPATDGHEEIEVDTPDAGDAESESEPAAQAEESEPAEPGTQQPAPEQSEPSPAQGGGQPTGGSQPGSESEPGAASQPTGGSQPSPAPQAPTGGDASGLMPARQHLTRTVNRLAQQAAAEEDPGRKREFLAATREAAEALEAVRDAE